MKRLLAIMIAATVALLGSIVSVFAEDESHVHNWSKWITEEEATCIEHGTDYRYCGGCGQYEYRETPLGSHSWGDWSIETKATPYKKGVKVRYCEECDKEQTKSIPKKKLTSNQKKAVKVVNSYMKYVKKFDTKKMKTCFNKYRIVSIYDYISKAMKKHNKKVKWSMVDVTGTGKTIKVKAKITRPDLYNRVYNNYYKWYQWQYRNPNASSSKKDNVLIKREKSNIKNSIGTSTDTVTFTVVKSSKGWKIKNRNRSMLDISLGFYFKAKDDAYDQFCEDYGY